MTATPPLLEPEGQDYGAPLQWLTENWPAAETAEEFCERVYRETGGVTPDLRRAYQFFLDHYKGDCPTCHGTGGEIDDGLCLS